MGEDAYDVGIVGAGIVGLSTAMALTQAGRRVVVLEAEPSLATHQSGRNSGVIHSGLYYRPGSLKAQNCVEGRRLLMEFCDQHAVPTEACGKLVVASRPEELTALQELERRGEANGLDGLERVRAEELRHYEPHVAGIAGLWVPQTGIVDYRAVVSTFAAEAVGGGARIELDRRVDAIESKPDGLVIRSSEADFTCSFLVNCAGLYADRVARMTGVEPEVQIIPFRGEYFEVTRRELVRNLIYPVPDPRFPFLGVHFTRRIDGVVEAGPNAVLAMAREGYRWRDVAPVDLLEMASYGGFWRMAGRYWRTGWHETLRSVWKRRFVRDLQTMVPELQERDVRRTASGVRAIAVDAAGRLVDDFRWQESARALHVLNAPSPAATASIAIGRSIAGRVAEIA